MSDIGKAAGTCFAAAIAAIDALNAEDPSVETLDGVSHPAALLYGQRMSAWLLRLGPGASEILRLAARAQHIARWKIPRSEFPDGRDGYLAWRTRLAAFHGETAGALLRAAGYDDAAVERWPRMRPGIRGGSFGPALFIRFSRAGSGRLQPGNRSAGATSSATVRGGGTVRKSVPRRCCSCASP